MVEDDEKVKVIDVKKQVASIYNEVISKEYELMLKL